MKKTSMLLELIVFVFDNLFLEGVSGQGDEQNRRNMKNGKKGGGRKRRRKMKNCRDENEQMIHMSYLIYFVVISAELGSGQEQQKMVVFE